MPAQTAPRTMAGVLKYDGNPHYTRETVTLLAGAKYPAGAVLGRITATGKYCLSPAQEETGKAGAEVACAVLLEDVDATAADAQGLVVARGMAIVSAGAIVLHPSVDTELEKSLKLQQLAAYGIVVRDQA